MTPDPERTDGEPDGSRPETPRPGLVQPGSSPDEVEAYLARAQVVILPRPREAPPARAPSEERPSAEAPAQMLTAGKVRVGVDLGTAYLVLAVLDEQGFPLGGEWQFAEVVRDGLVVDFIGAIDLLRGMKQRVEERLGVDLTHAATGYPPGVPRTEVRATAHVLEAAGMDCTGLIDEPSAANNVLRIRDGAIVDVGGGTTGVAVVKGGEVVYTADEATGGTHFSLVIAGSLGLSFEEAERLKTTPAEQARLFPLIRPVMEKVAAITSRHIQGWHVPSITLVGGTSAFPGMAGVVEAYTGIRAMVAPHPMFVTPLGIALQDSN